MNLKLQKLYAYHNKNRYWILQKIKSNPFSLLNLLRYSARGLDTIGLSLATALHYIEIVLSINCLIYTLIYLLEPSLVGIICKQKIYLKKIYK